MPLYLILDLAVLAIPLAFSFEKRLQFYKMWPALFGSILLVGLVFITWDVHFTRIGVWGFNPAYLTGIYLWNLPLEEYLFFFCVPYAAVFTFRVFRTLMPAFTLPDKMVSRTVYSLAVVLLTAGIVAYSRWYTCTAFIAAGISLLLSVRFFSSLMPHFILSFSAILLPFFLMNGILTGSFIDGEVVWYDNAENLGIRMGTIPFEDIFYGMTLIIWNVNLANTFTWKQLK